MTSWRVSELRVGGERLVVLSVALADVDLEQRLTVAEAAVARLAIAGHTNAEIAARRRTSVRTVANQMAAILRKLGLRSRRELRSQA